MKTIEESIEVDVPVGTAYDQWTHFDQFPQFMARIKDVIQLDGKRLHWRAEVAGREKVWDAEILEQIPDQRIAWRSISGLISSGIVDFKSLGPNRTHISLALTYEPEDTIENMDNALGISTASVVSDLKNFKMFIEKRRTPTGSWRGIIRGREVLRP